MPADMTFGEITAEMPEDDSETRDSSSTVSVENADMFDADGALSRAFLLRRGSCCQYGCKNCPYRVDNSVSAR